MHEDPTKDLKSTSFEERVFARFDAMDARLERLESRSYDTKPIWERALKEIADTRAELGEVKKELVDMRREFTQMVVRRFDLFLRVREADHEVFLEAERRLTLLESKLA
jgi:hypothetical protein